MRLLVALWKIFCYAAGTAVAGIAIYEFWFLAQILYWVDHNPTTTSVMDSRLDALREKDPAAALAHNWVPYQRISNELKRAIIVAEDARFTEHDGFDWEGIQRALEKNQRRGRIVAGGSTITQQLAKNLFLSGERTLLRKGQEAVLAAMLEATMSKRRIFEIYLNVVEWGENVFGAEAAARHYFGVGADGLDSEQAARLAAMLPRPRYYDRNRDSAYLTSYSDSILVQMYAAQIP
ncbi:MAG TPA: monofunctional biosynthetic peptidoglycan transglycosylase [Burkholderiales bacterium]|nr:monofunctional biosynthetic peptidoglycan transglycosylase [Burkholderiales bacterium]HYA46975.1 monofunctional biosynthetic peptidoglycan transglycosylase [Burkholderiales bacterium]